MDEKQLLIEEDLPQPQLQQRGRKRCTLAKKARNIALTALLAATGVHVLRWGAGAFAGHGCAHHHRINTYDGEHIEWTACGEVDGRELECSTVEVPADHFGKHDDNNQTFSIALARLRGKNATKNLLINPGGPGGSGVEFVRRAGKQLRSIIGEDHHILGFDPRGVGASTPLAICYPDQDTRDKNSVRIPTDPVHDAPFASAYSKNLGQACADTMGDYGKFIDTPQTAADMNSILDAVGQDGLVYWGFSYGTLLGQTYAGIFPERSERVIIDGVVDHFAWYDDLVDHSDLVDTENVVAGFFDECIKAGDDCPLSSFAYNAKDLQRNVTRFIDNLYQDPISVYVDSKTYGVLDHRTIWYDAVFPATYKPAAWYQLADNLANLLSGDGSKALRQYALGPGAWGDMLLEHNLIIANNDHRTGKKEWPQSKQKILEKILPSLDDSAFAAGQFADYFSRAFWRIPTTHTYKPKKDVKTRHPLLILSTTYDPVCPLSSAKVAQKSFRDSKLVEVLGYGHCSIAVQSTCLANHVRAFLNDGTLPEEKHSKCEVNGKYFVSPEAKAIQASSVTMSEEEEILAAQRELSEALEFIRRM